MTRAVAVSIPAPVPAPYTTVPLPGNAPVAVGATTGTPSAAIVERGPIGPEGPPGPPGANAGFEHTQSAPAATWIIPHALGRRPVVSVFDTAGNEIVTDIAATASVVSIAFAQATAGFASIT